MRILVWSCPTSPFELSSNELIEEISERKADLMGYMKGVQETIARLEAFKEWFFDKLEAPKSQESYEQITKNDIEDYINKFQQAKVTIMQAEDVKGELRKFADKKSEIQGRLDGLLEAFKQEKAVKDETISLQVITIEGQKEEIKQKDGTIEAQERKINEQNDQIAQKDKGLTTLANEIVAIKHSHIEALTMLKKGLEGEVAPKVIDTIAAIEKVKKDSSPEEKIEALEKNWDEIAGEATNTAGSLFDVLDSLDNTIESNGPTTLAEILGSL